MITTAYSNEQLHSMDITLSRFQDSFNFMFGLTHIGNRDDGFNIQNNPYVEFIGYELTPGTE